MLGNFLKFFLQDSDLCNISQVKLIKYAEEHNIEKLLYKLETFLDYRRNFIFYFPELSFSIRFLTDRFEVDKFAFLFFRNLFLLILV